MDSQEKYVQEPVEEEQPRLDLGTLVLMGAVTVVSISLMVLGVVKFGELVRIAMRWW
jgi:hypothetical protein